MFLVLDSQIGYSGTLLKVQADTPMSNSFALIDVSEVRHTPMWSTY